MGAFVLWDHVPGWPQGRPHGFNVCVYVAAVCVIRVWCVWQDGKHACDCKEAVFGEKGVGCGGEF